MKGDSPLESELRIPKIFKEIRSSSTVSQIIWHSRARKSEVFDPSASTSLPRRGDDATSRPPTTAGITVLPSSMVEKVGFPQPSTSTDSLPACTDTAAHQRKFSGVDETGVAAAIHTPTATTPLHPLGDVLVGETTSLPSTSTSSLVQGVENGDSASQQLNVSEVDQAGVVSGLVVPPGTCTRPPGTAAEVSSPSSEPTPSLLVEAEQGEKAEYAKTEDHVSGVHHEICLEKENNEDTKKESASEVTLSPHVSVETDGLEPDERNQLQPTSVSTSTPQKPAEGDLCLSENEEVDVDLVFRWQGVSECRACVCLHEQINEFFECSFSMPLLASSSKSPGPAPTPSKPDGPSSSSHPFGTHQIISETEPHVTLSSLPLSKPSSPLPVLGSLSDEACFHPQSPFSPTFSDEPLSPKSGGSCMPATPISPGAFSSAWTELEDTVFAESTSSVTSMPLLKRIERLKLGIVQLRNFAMDNEDVQLVVNVKFDAQEIFQSTTVPSGANCIFGDETNFELPPKFHALHLVVTQIVEAGRLTRPIGRVSLRRRDLIDENESFDGWMPIVKIAGCQTTEILGDMCLDLSYDTKSRHLSVGVLDYTVWPLNTTTSTSRNHQRLQDVDTLKTGVSKPGCLYLRTCISSDKSLLSSMKKSRVVERRTLESIRLDCSQLFSSSSSKYSRTHPEGEKSPLPKDSKHSKQVDDPTKLPPKPPKARSHQIPSISQRITYKTGGQDDVFEHVAASLSVSSASASSSTATTPSWKMAGSNLTPTPTPAPLVLRGNGPVKTGGNFFFPSTSTEKDGVVEKDHHKPSDSNPVSQHQLRLNIKVYSEASYDENSYCGYVRVPLDSKSMLPKNLPLGPNWFNIKSRTVNSVLDTPLAECNTTPTSSTKTTPSSSKDLGPAHFRHCSSPSTSAANPLPQYNHAKIGSGSLGKSGMLATRSQPLRPAPSLASLRGLLTGNTSSNTMAHCNPAASSNAKNTGRDASVDSIARTMTNDKLGEMRLRLWYNVEEVLPFFHYQPLYTNLIKSLSVKPYSSSLTSLLSYLPIDMEHIAKPLMKIFVHAHQIRAFFRLVCSEYVSSCHDVNTLFRSQTMASKIMYELMKFVGHDYLVISLKPLIDLIYAERKCCEIDPSKLKAGDSLEHNLRNITVYAELAFSRVVDSYSRCPHVLREVFLELREVVHTYFPDRDDVARLALSSFLIMRFFAAAILNPKLFALKRDTPDADVCRTLVLVSKILQRLANCVVSSVPLTTKEQWLTPVLMRFSSDAHKSAMINFLDGVSAVSLAHDHTALAANDENISPTVYKESPVVLLKHGQMVERRSGTDKKRSFKNLIHQKRRYVTLTETQLSWQKVKDASSAGGESPSEAEQHKGFSLSEITAVSPLPEVKNSFRVATPSSEVHFQANNASEMNEWLIVILKQQRRHIMKLNRPCSEPSNLLPLTPKASEVVDVDMEREMQIIHSHFYEHLDTLHKWKNSLDGQDLDQFLHHLHSSGGPRGVDALKLGLPLDKILSANSNLEEQKTCLVKLRETISTTIGAVEQIQAAHHSAKNLSYSMKVELSPTKNMNSLDQIISTSTAMSGQKMVDSENYLHLRQRNKRIKKSANQFSASAKMPPSSPAIISGQKGKVLVQQHTQATNM